MRGEKASGGASSIDLASVVRGLYGRVARQLDLDPSYVSRVARGERRSEVVEVAIEREILRVMQIVNSSHHAQYSNGARSTKAAKRPSSKAVA